MNAGLKAQILESEFADKVRLHIIDDDAFNKLCALLSMLASDWKGQADIDKEIVSDLYVTIMVTLGAARRLSGRNSPDAFRVEEMAIRLDELILECLTDGS